MREWFVKRREVLLWALGAVVVAGCGGGIEAALEKGDVVTLEAHMQRACAATFDETCETIAARFGELCSATSNAAVLKFYRAGTPVQRAKMLPLLADCRVEGAVEELVAEVMNIVETGGDAGALMPVLMQLDPMGLRRKKDASVKAGDDARARDNPRAALRHYADALVLAPMVGGGEVIEKRIADAKADTGAVEAAALLTSTVEELEKGHVFTAFALSKRLGAVAPACVKGAWQSAHDKLAAVERAEAEHHKRGEVVRQAMSTMAVARAAWKDAVAEKSSEVASLRANYEAAKARYDTAMGSMIPATRALNAIRGRIPTVVRALRAVEKEMASCK